MSVKARWPSARTFIKLLPKLNPLVIVQHHTILAAAVDDAAMRRGGNGLKSLHSSSHLLSKGRPAHSPSFTPGVVQDVAVLGGGITGLATAYFLTKECPQARVTVYEASDRVGGWINSKRVPVKDGEVLFEAGPRTLRPQNNGILTARLVRQYTIFPLSTVTS